ncbi:hypothetical protein Nepgr_028415 [Nepenthes gracilis]|uniref:Uncharacterized protein n=1 Tax=Nepenthes gracilis TaxID=150966 RepID=A0AAD3TBZ2_NEPGR|nr:hypothetical protein Nepgr_028415 [Nepenthes gracilis]
MILTSPRVITEKDAQEIAIEYTDRHLASLMLIHGQLVNESSRSRTEDHGPPIGGSFAGGSVADKFGRTKTFQLEADLVSRMAMIVGYTHLGHPIKASKLLVDEWWVGIEPNSVTPISVLSASTPLGHLKMGKTAHYLVLSAAVSCVEIGSDFDVWNSNVLGLEVELSAGKIVMFLVLKFCKTRTIVLQFRFWGIENFQGFRGYEKSTLNHHEIQQRKLHC